MGREIKRIALDFDWPPGKTWKGYLNHEYKPCPGPEGSSCVAGYTPAGKWLETIMRLLLMCAEAPSEPNKPLHPYLQNIPGAPQSVNNPWEVIPPSQDIQELVKALTKCTMHPTLGYGGEAAYDAAENLKTLLGLEPEWGICPLCNGEGIDPNAWEAYEAWEQTEPPEGDGWQVWETVSEGSPVSPVFPTAEALVDWLCQPKGSDEKWTSRCGNRVYSEQGRSREAAEAFVNTGWVPSMISSPETGLVSGIDAALKLTQLNKT